MTHAESVIDVERRLNRQSCNVLNDLRKNGQLCDAVIRVENGSFPVHKAIMSACSPYFRALFTNGMHETGEREVTVPGVTADIMAVLVEFAYTLRAKITPANAAYLLPAADQFHILGLVNECCDVIRSQIDCNNCLGIRSFAEHYFCTDLEKTAQTYILENFPEISAESNEFLQLSFDQLIALTSLDELNVKNEEIVFKGIIRWVDHSPKTRKQHIGKLLESIRLGLLSRQFFVEKVMVHPFIQNNNECRPLIIETLKFLYDLNMHLSHPLANPRIPHKILFVVGGWSGRSPTNVIETYDIRADRWDMVDSTDKGPRAYHGCTTVDGIIYVAGGFDGMDYLNSMRAYSPITKTWQEVAPMNARRCYVSVAVLNHHIYAMGGFDGHERQNTAERYSPKTNQWSLITPMNQRRSDSSACSVGDCMYICGGYNGQECLKSCESYNPATNQWTMIAPMHNQRSGVGVIGHAGFLYAIGGYDGITRMNNGEKWNPSTNTWTIIAEMYRPRSNFGIVVIDDMVFAIGGFSGKTTLFKVECFDPSSEEWYDCTDMNIYRSALSACVVEGLPNIHNFIHKNSNKKHEKQ